MCCPGAKERKAFQISCCMEGGKGTNVSNEHSGTFSNKQLCSGLANSFCLWKQIVWIQAFLVILFNHHASIHTRRSSCDDSHLACNAIAVAHLALVVCDGSARRSLLIDWLIECCQPFSQSHFWTRRAGIVHNSPPVVCFLTLILYWLHYAELKGSTTSTTFLFIMIKKYC